MNVGYGIEAKMIPHLRQFALHESVGRDSPKFLSSGDKIATTADIKQLSDTIAREFHPKKIVLFGSHAWGIPKSDSDVDILVILPFEGKNWRMASTIRERVHPAFPLDLLVRTESQINERLNHHDTFLTEVMVKGRVLHEG